MIDAIIALAVSLLFSFCALCIHEKRIRKLEKLTERIDPENKTPWKVNL